MKGSQVRKAAGLLVILLLCLFALLACGERDAIYTVSFDSCGGTPVAAVRVHRGDKFPMPPAPTREGFVFYGWYYDAACQTPFRPEIYHAEGNLTLYARWVDALIYDHPISVAAMTHGTVMVEGERTEAKSGTSITLYPMPEVGYRLKEGSLCLNGVPLEGFTFTMPPESVVITAEFELEDYHILPLNLQNAFLYTDQDSYHYRDRATITLVPDLGYYVEWAQTADGVAIRDGETLTMEAQDVYITARVRPIDYALTHSLSIATHGGGGLVADRDEAAQGEWVTLTATPQEGNCLASIRVNGTEIASNRFLMPGEAVQVEAEFSPIASGKPHAIVPKSHAYGSLSCDLSQAKLGEEVHVQAQPQEGYAFLGVVVNGQYCAGDTFRMPGGEARVSGVFRAAAYHIRVLPTQGGTLEVASDAAYAGTYLQVSVRPDDGYRYEENSLRVNEGWVEVTGLGFIMPQQDVEVSARFVPLESQGSEHRVQVSDSYGGKLEVDRESARPGEVVRVQVVPDAGYRLVAGSLHYNGTSFDAEFYMPDADVRIGAEFERVYAIQVGVAERGQVFAGVTQAAAGERVQLHVFVTDEGDGFHTQVFVNGEVLNGSSFVMPACDVVLTIDVPQLGSQAFSIETEAVEGCTLDAPLEAFMGEYVSPNVTVQGEYRLVCLEWQIDEDDWTECPAAFYMPGAPVRLRAKLESAPSTYPVRALLNTLTRQGVPLQFYDTPQALAQFYGMIGVTDGIPATALAFHVAEQNCAWTGVIFHEPPAKDAYFSNRIAAYYRGLWGSGEAHLYNDGILIVCQAEGRAELYAQIVRNGLEQIGKGLYCPMPGGWLLYKYRTDAAWADLRGDIGGSKILHILPGAFSDCRALQTLYLGAVGQLDGGALHDLPALRSLYFGDVGTLTADAFVTNGALADIHISATRNYRVQEGVVYSWDGTRAIAAIKQFSHPDIVLAPTCRQIEAYCFYASNVQTADLNGVVRVGDHAFDACRDLHALGANGLRTVRAIGAAAFAQTAITQWALEGQIQIGPGALPLQADTLFLVYPAQNNAPNGILGEDPFVGNGRPTFRFYSLEVMNDYGLDALTTQFSDAFELDQSVVDSLGAGYGILVYRSCGGSYQSAQVRTQKIKYTLPTPTRAGYVFEGWYWDAAYTERLDDGIRLQEPLTEIFAKWRLSEEIISF